MKFTLSRILNVLAKRYERIELKEIEGGGNGVTFEIIHEENFVTRRFPSYWRSEEKCEEIFFFLHRAYNRSENAKRILY